MTKQELLKILGDNGNEYFSLEMESIVLIKDDGSCWANGKRVSPSKQALQAMYDEEFGSLIAEFMREEK